MGAGFLPGVGKWLAKTFVGKLITSYAVSVVTNKLFGPKQKNYSPTYAIGQLQTQVNSNLPMSLVYGKVKMAGNKIWDDSAEGATEVHMLVGFGLGEIKGFSDVRINDIPISELTGCSYTAYVGNGTQEVDSRVGLTRYNDESATVLQSAGTYNIGDIYDTTTDGEYVTTRIITSRTEAEIGEQLYWYLTLSKTRTLTLAGRTALVGSLKYDAYLAITIKPSDKLNGSSINVTAIVEGRLVRIYSTPTVYTTGWSDNPHWCALDYQMLDVGCGVPDAGMDIQSFITAAAYSDQQPNNGIEGEKRFTLNLAMDEKKSRQDWLAEIYSTCRSYPTYQRGKHGVLVDKPESVSQIFDVLAEDLEFWWSDLEDEVERFSINFIDPDNEWTRLPATADMPAFKNPNSPIAKDADVNGITNARQACREAWFHLNLEQTCKEWVQIKTNRKALNRSIGNVIGVREPLMRKVEDGLDYKRYRMMSMTEMQGLGIVMICREYNANIYTDQMGSVASTVNIIKPYNPANVPSVSNIVITEAYHVQKDGTVIAYIAGSCDLPSFSLIDSGIVEYSENNGDSWQYNSTISTGNFVVNNVKTGVTYLIRIKTESRSLGLYSGWIVSDPIAITGKDDPPSNVADFELTNITGGFNLSWAANSEPDMKTYRVYKGMDNAIFSVCTLIADNFLSTNLFVEASVIGDYIFYIVAVDKSLNVSTPVSATGTIT